MAKYLQFDQVTQAPAGATPSALPDRWHQPWTLPVRQKIAPALAVAIATSGLISPNFTPPPRQVEPATISSDVIFQRSFIYQSETQPVLPVDILTVDKFFAPWSEPTRRTGIPVALQQQPVRPNFTPPVFILQGWSEPVRVKQGLARQLQDVGAPDVVLPPPVLVSQWNYAWSEPTRLKRLSPALQPATTLPVTTPAASTVVSVETFTDNVVFPRSFIYQSQTKPVFPPTPVIPTFFNLTQGDTGLIFQKSIVYQVNTDPIGVTAPFTYQPWSEPVRTKKLAVALQPAFFSANFTPAPPVFTDIRWIYGWSEPTRRIGLATSKQQSLAWSNFTPPPPVAAIVNETFTSDVIYPRSFIYQSQTKPIFTQPPAPVVESQWHYPWSEPVRLRRFNTALQSATSLITPPAPNFIRTINWYQPYSEPVRQKKGLRAWLQQFFDTDHKPPAQAPVTLVMNATEVNSDVASFAINVFTPSPVTPQPYTVRVSITEVQSGLNPWSIEEI